MGHVEYEQQLPAAGRFMLLSSIWNRLTNCINLMSTEPPNLMGHLPFSHKTQC